MDDTNPVVPQDENTEAQAPVVNPEEVKKEEEVAAQAGELEGGETPAAEESAM